MSLLSDLTDAITGGANQNAAGDLAQALQNVEAVPTPTAQQLQLSPLAQYASTGNLNPALATAASSGPSAYNSENISAVPMSAMQQALSYDQALAGSNGMTPQEQAAIAQAEQSVNENTAGQRGALEQSFAGMGVPQSLISAALQNGTIGQESEQAYQNALQAQASAANNALTANNAAANIGSQMYGQETGQANTIAAAQNALNQFNAANTQQTNLTNQANQQAANTYNTENSQSLANQNVQGQQTVQEQNQVEAPQEAASLALQKAGEEAGVGEAQAGQQTAAGQQSAGLFGGLLGAGATLGASALAPSPTVNIGTAVPAYDGGMIKGYDEGGDVPQPQVPPTMFLRGGAVPGQARVAGNSPTNDVVPAKLSPGEFVVNRQDMANPKVRAFLAQNTHTPRPPASHPSDIAAVMRALSELRGGQPNA